MAGLLKRLMHLHAQPLEQAIQPGKAGAAYDVKSDAGLASGGLLPYLKRDEANHVEAGLFPCGLLATGAKLIPA